MHGYKMKSKIKSDEELKLFFQRINNFFMHSGERSICFSSQNILSISPSMIKQSKNLQGNPCLWFSNYFTLYERQHTIFLVLM